ncbi:MAG: rhomboid family intramembrane serine protease [Bacteroidetes bacterium]|nr:rhomboid family intramembrane serine protease [Bacteroidota bacterium]
MFFPYGDDQVHGGHRPLISYTFLALNIGVFIWQLIEPGGGAFTMRYSAVPADILALRHWDTLVTSMFLHGGFLHLLGNMVFLWIFADNIESTIGSPRFLLFYLLGGIAATAAHTITDPFSPVPMLGASGAISAVLGAYLVMYPRSRIKVFLLFLVLIPFRVPAVLFLGLWFYMQMTSGLGALNGESGGVAWWAHIGGFAFGLASGFWMRSNIGYRRLRVR